MLRPNKSAQPDACFVGAAGFNCSPAETATSSSDPIKEIAMQNALSIVIALITKGPATFFAGRHMK